MSDQAETESRDGASAIEDAAAFDLELELENAVIKQIDAAHGRDLERARAVARQLADEAAEASEEGIRDLVDEDGEVDAAVRAALVRQTSARAMHAFRRAQELEDLGDALAFGRVVNDAGETTYIGRHSVIEGDDALLVDWRARAAMPFYRATPMERLGVQRRRHLLYGEGEHSHELAGYSDEVFDVDDLHRHQGLRGEAAILASVSAPTAQQMQSVVATIQAEQDAIVRAPSDGALVVQGGPGTGKTVVALHRAAYLLYDQRAELADTGVLIVGPSSEFLSYIAGVLPSLGESGVVSLTAEQLYPGVLLGRSEDAAVAATKGRPEMALLLAQAVKDRQRQPQSDLKVRYGATRVRLTASELQRLFVRAQRYRAHNEGSNAFRALVIEALCDAVYDPSFNNRADARETFSRSSEVERFLLRHWPSLTPEQALNDLFGSSALLRLARRDTGLRTRDVLPMWRERVDEEDLDRSRWTVADAPLLDELLVLVGGKLGGQTEEERSKERDAADEFELSEEEDESVSLDAEDLAVDPGLLDFEDPWTVEDEPADPEDVMAHADLLHEDVEGSTVEVDLEEEGELIPDSVDALEDGGVTVAELAFGQRDWRFGHVIVDEAQDLTPMQWRMIVRRARGGSMTIVGDLAQRSTGEPGALVEGWRSLVPSSIASFSYRELTVDYRSPAEINALAARVLAEIAPALPSPRPIRTVGRAPAAVCLHRDRLVEDLVALARSVRSDTVGTVAVVGFELPQRLHAVDGVAVLDPWQAKGLEFDAAIVVEPARILEEPHGPSLLYVAITRATQSLTIAGVAPLPSILGRLDPLQASAESS